MMRPQKFPIRRGRGRERETPLVFEGDETGPSAIDGDERELIPGDDCEAIADDPADKLILYHLMMRKKMRDGKLVRMQHQLMRFYSWERRFHLHLSSNKLFLGIL